jgi:glycosyltransferase involved in cell wall biosynthesis
MVVIKICISEWNNASRDKRELAIVNDLGACCVVIAKGLPNDKGRKTNISGYDTYLYSTKPLGAHKFLNVFNRLLSVFIWASNVRKHEGNILSCHDLGAFLIGWLSTFLMTKNKKPLLIYDSHEFEIGRCGNRNKVSKWIIIHLERFLMKKCVFSIMVNDTIADEVQRIHNQKVRPIVVRSIPEYWNIDEVVIKQTRFELLRGNGLPVDTFTIMYHGGIIKDRGIETLIELVSINPNISGVILGNGQKDYMKYLQSLVKEKRIESRIIFHPAVPIEELWKYVGAADVGMVMIRNVCLNHYYSLPNKFFENIQSMTPVIGSNFPEIKRIIEQYQIGMICNPDDIQEINQCVEKMRIDKEFYKQCKKNLIQAKKDLCWEKEKKILEKSYKELI